jgi:methyl coenzyme M reductase beta subunit
MQRYSAAQLAATIQQVVAEANASLNDSIGGQYRDILGDSFDLDALTDPDAAAEAVAHIRRTGAGDDDGNVRRTAS